ncbi:MULTISPECIES: hypothetical protein [Thermomonospora]|uniref:Uncharacterized protein n=1 Tax=Thermomonospora curvata (strain ATCC 19995 / DSM 43183 / JCM 3096 / KCTC 9072 / NBRC 15933 / NCIMB 10081 / Henssen B9) TaxID=471852 RepID=D1AA46_THECD|nr:MULTISPECIES: hypothetical protein [Thermomonospora]ACY96982.1 hypothetical protein Tcur_1401 [Thermomonospora curvata DSM 43183]
MIDTFRRIGGDLKKRRHVEAYVVSAGALLLAVFSLIVDQIPEDLRWAVISAGIALLVYQITVPERTLRNDRLLADRSDFEDHPLPRRFRTARQVWLFAPSGSNVLSSANCDVLRRRVLSRPDGVVRVVVLDPLRDDAVTLAAHQLTGSVDFTHRRFPQTLRCVVEHLQTMAQWPVNGEFGYRLFGFNPGFSLLAIDPHQRGGILIVEFHGVRNESISSRMHIVLTRARDGHWYDYWLEQFEHIWRNARVPAALSSGVHRPE